MKGTKPIIEYQPKTRLLGELEEEVLVQYIVNLDNRGFSSRLKDIEDMVNNILMLYNRQSIGKL